MYSSFPKRDSIAIRLALASAWFFSVVSGVGSVWFTPTAVRQGVGEDISNITGAILLAASALAFYAVIANKYQWEWIAAWFAAGGAATYVMVVWILFFQGQVDRIQSAGALTSLMLFYVYRIVACSAHARKQRSIHDLLKSGEVTLPHGPTR